MAMLKAQLAKIEFVLEIARKDPQTFLPDLLDDPLRTLKQSGLDLSEGEALAVIDIVHGTSWSPLASRLQRHRELLDEIVADNPEHGEKRRRRREGGAEG